MLFAIFQVALKVSQEVFVKAIVQSFRFQPDVEDQILGRGGVRPECVSAEHKVQ